MNNTNIAKKCAGKKYIDIKIQLDITNICENEDDELASQQNSFLRIKVIEALCVTGRLIRRGLFRQYIAGSLFRRG